MEESSEQDIRKSVFCKFHWMSQLSVTASSWVLRGPMIQILPEGWVPPGAASASAGWREVSENPSGILQHSLSLPMLLCQLKSNLTSKTCWWESCLKLYFFYTVIPDCFEFSVYKELVGIDEILMILACLRGVTSFLITP